MFRFKTVKYFIVLPTNSENPFLDFFPSRREDLRGSLIRAVNLIGKNCN